MSKRFFVLFSKVQAFLPQVYKSKATVNKYILKNQTLSFEMFESQQAANNFVDLLKSDTTFPDMGRQESIGSKKKAAAAVKEKSSKSKTKRQAKNKKSKIKVKSDQIYESDLLTYEKQQGFIQQNVILRLKDYLTIVRSDTFRNFERSEQIQLETTTVKVSISSETISKKKEQTASEVQKPKQSKKQANKTSQKSTPVQTTQKMQQETQNIPIDEQLNQEQEYRANPLPDYLVERIKKSIPFYKASPIANLTETSINNLKIHTNVFRRQNPGYTLASYTIMDSKSEEVLQTREKIPLGVTKVQEGEIFGLVCALSDLSVSKMDEQTTFDTYLWCKQDRFERFERSLDSRVRNAADLLRGIKKECSKVQYL